MYKHISHIVLKNFQSIKNLTRIDFAPITLLYGPNSAGKSAIFDAVRYGIRLCEGFEPFSGFDEIEDDLVKYMHQHDFKEEMIIGIGAHGYLPQDNMNLRIKSNLPEGDWLVGIDYDPEVEKWDTEWEVLFNFLFSVSFHSDQNPLQDEPCSVVAYTSEIIISESGKKLAEIKLVSAGIGSFIRLYITHPSARKLIQIVEMHEGNFDQLCELAFEEDKYSINEAFLTVYGGFDTDVYVTIPDSIWQYPSPLKKSSGLTNVDRAGKVLTWLFQNIIIAPMAAVIRNKTGHTHIGPTRKIPQLNELIGYAGKEEDKDNFSLYFYNSMTEMNSKEDPCWLNGSIAWKYIIDNRNVKDWPGPRSLVDAVNDWLTREDRLNAGYRIVRDYREFAQKAARTRQPTTGKYREGTPAESSDGVAIVRFFDTKLNTLVSIEDLGTGISQVVPVLVASYIGLQNFIEQPELHLHPKMQALLADLFISCWNCDQRRFVLESHSEMLALRILRRIRETARADIKHRQFSIKPEDVAFYYLNPTEDGTEVTKLRASPNGEFLDRWPKGFFAEREAELFDEDD